MICSCGNDELIFIGYYDKIINDKAIIHNIYYCPKCNLKMTEILGKIYFWYTEEIVKMKNSNIGVNVNGNKL